MEEFRAKSIHKPTMLPEKPATILTAAASSSAPPPLRPPRVPRPRSVLECYVGQCDFHRTHFLCQFFLYLLLLVLSLLLIPTVFFVAGFVVGFAEVWPVSTAFVCGAFLLSAAENVLIHFGLWQPAPTA